MCRHLFISSLVLMLCGCFDSNSSSSPEPAADGAIEPDVGVLDGEMPTDSGRTLDGGAETASVGWCNTQFPPALEAFTGASTDSIYGHVYVEGCTDGPSNCEGVEVELGVGPVDQDPSADSTAWAWTPATLNAAYAEDNNDEYSATHSADTVGVFAYAFRARLGDDDWTYCDLGGSDDGFSLAETGRLTVTDPADLAIGWCAIQYPSATSVAVGGPTAPIYGQVFVEGCSEGEQRCERVQAQVGFGAQGALPDENWQWVDAAYNASLVEGNNDEYSASLTVPTEGTFAYAYRFRLGDEGEWVLCDTDGADGVADAAQLGTLEVAVRPIEWCNIQFPEAIEGAVDTDVGPIYGRVYSPECTEGDAQCWGLWMQVGVGPADTSPLDAPDAFAWVNGAPNTAHTEDDNDEFEAAFTLSAEAAYYVVRFSGDGGSNWTYCDLDGTPFEPAQMGTITLVDP